MESETFRGNQKLSNAEEKQFLKLNLLPQFNSSLIKASTYVITL